MTDQRAVLMGLVIFAGGFGLLGQASAQRKESVKERMLGAWQLESRTVRTAGGGVVADPVLGAQPIGRLFYDASGHMMLQMMRQQRTQAIGAPSNPEDAKNPRVVLGYDAYFGSFTVNESEGTVTHHVEGSLFPEDLGKDFTRLFTLEGDRFTLRFTSKSPDGLDVTRTLIFRRSK